MKIRNGFVSNSSSSSFVIGIAEIVDETKVTEFLKKVGYTHIAKELFDYTSDVKIISGKDLKANKCRVISFDRTYVSISETLVDDNKLYFVFDYTGNEGDTAFYSHYNRDGDYYDIDYDKAYDIDFYDKWVQAIILELQDDNTELFINKSVLFGAGRNG